MKLVRWGAKGAELPGLVDAHGKVRDLSPHCTDITPEMLAPDRLDRLRAIDPATLHEVPSGTRLGVPVAAIGNIIGIGLNYRDHALEAGMALPPEPVVFSKHTGALSGANDPIPLPMDCAKLDYEVELAVVIGSPAWQVDEASALTYVAGYATANDVSARDWQIERGGQWVKGKSAPAFCPLGPWLVTADEVPDPQALKLWCDVNGDRRQNGSTANMVFGVAHLVSYLSRFIQLDPGDVIVTGTPAGVGMGKGLFLNKGDRVDLSVEGLGQQSTKIV